MPETREAVILQIMWPKNGTPNPGNPWVIVKTNDPEYSSWKGNVAALPGGAFNEHFAPGTWVRAVGYPKQEGRFPPAFVVTEVLQAESEKTNVAKAWLSWRLPEIGDARAERLSERYGLHLPDLLDGPDAKDALSQIAGLTPARVKKIMETYKDYPGELRLSMYLGQPDPEKDTGLSWPAIKTAITEYREHNFGGIQQLASDVANDPYELMAVPGITFAAVDNLAEGLGIEDRDPRRVRGMVWEKLDTLAGKNGVCLEPVENLMRLQNLGYNSQELMAILSESRHFVFYPRFGAQLSEIVSAEMTFSGQVLKMLAQPEQPELPLAEDTPEWLDDSQREAVRKLQTARVAILTGGPGTGKTTVLKTALDQMERRGALVKLAAFAGKAARRMTETTGRPASTIHKLLEWKPEGFARHRGNPIDADVIVIDEASMLDIKLASSLLDAVAAGTRLIFVGDVNQLPPVGPGQPLLDLMRTQKVQTLVLTKTHRQKADSWVIDNAPRILEGKMPSLKDQSDFQFVDLRESGDIIEAVISLYRQAREEGPEAERQLQVLTPVHNIGAGTRALNTEVQRALNPRASDSRFADDYVQGSGETKIYAGDKVLYTKNNADIGLVNGSMGVVLSVHVTADSRSARVKFEGEVNPVDETDEFELYDEFLRPLTLAYAMTVHKSQGSEWSNVVVIADRAQTLRRKLLYTAITRTNQMLIILGTEAAVARGVSNNSDENRATLLQQRLRGEL